MSGSGANGGAPAAFGDIVRQVAATLSDVTQTDVGATLELRRGTRLFAVLVGDAVEVVLPPDIAEAALRTPGTSPSARGAAWISFLPVELDQYAEDRLRAWLTTAWRAAERSI
jgi:hypothetical protein